MGTVSFENYSYKKDKIDTFLKSNGISSLEEAKVICFDAGLDIEEIVRNVQRICFDDAPWAYIVGASVALKRKSADACVIANTLGEALQSFCLNGSVADQRAIGIGHGKLAAMVLDDNNQCFAFLAGHESFAAAGGAIGIAGSANIVRKRPLKVILNGLGKDAAEIIARINGFTYVRTKFDLLSGALEIVDKTPYSNDVRSTVKCYGANEMREGTAIMVYEKVDISISGNGTNMVKFQHPVAGAYKKYCNDNGLNYFACASGGGIGRTMNNDDISAGPASYGFTDMLSRMYADAVFAGSSSVPAHVEMMGFIGMGNNPLVGATVKIAVAVSKILNSEVSKQ
jgi:hypothetical protein